MSLQKTFFAPVVSWSAEDLKAFMAQKPEGGYTLLDVRQPSEYRESHLPGAKLIPLSQLDTAVGQLDPQKPVAVYCAIGGRSRVAAQLLAGRGFREVFNLKGGIKAWKGFTAEGPRELDLDLIRGDETPAEIIAIALAMEKGLGRFYRAAAERAQDQPLIDLLQRLAGFEVKHQQALMGLYVQMAPGDPEGRLLQTGRLSGIMEGGFGIDAFLAQNAAYLNSLPDLLTLAMMLETQAMDLYLRFADKSGVAETREVLFKVANEEKQHLGALADLYEANA
ncbi:MAG: rhodanese-like domain-containing protein [Desulfobacteraceae bacterium]|jgi:rhodanese-related sulfurtransferase